MCKVTVIIPVFNSSKSIIPCLESVVNQTYKNFCVIIVDDGSTDNTVDVINAFIAREVCVSFEIIKQKNAGPSKARNTGSFAAKTEFIAFLDSDDIWLPNHLQTLINSINGKKCDFVCTTKNLTHSKQMLLTLHKMLLRCYIQSSTMLLKKKVFVDCGGFNENKRYSEDYQFWLEICAKKYKVLFLPVPDVKSFDGKASYGVSGLSANIWAMEKGELDNYRGLYKSKKISFSSCLCIIIFSLFKYFIRSILVKVK